MKTSSADGTKDAMLGIVVIIVFPVLVYLVLTNADLIIDYAIWIILASFMIGGIMTAYPYIDQWIRSDGEKMDEDQPKQPENVAQVDGDEVVQAVELDPADGISLDNNEK